jgi:chromosome segregation ATPase
VQIRLTNFELLQKIKELEMLRQNAYDDANRLQREIQRLVPHASNCVTLQRLFSQNREKFLRLRIAQQASQCYWERLESSYYQQTAQIFSLQDSINDLGVQLKRAKTQRQGNPV